MSISVKILGSNSASFAHHRHHTSQVVQVHDQFFLVDCGEGTQLQAKKYNVKLSRIDHILISHLHGDHYYGLIGLLSTMHLYGRQKQLNLVCPPGLIDILSLQLRHSGTDLNYPINYIEWVPGEHTVVLDLPKLTVHTIPLDHSVPCSGYFFKEKPNKRRLNAKALPERLNPLQINELKEGRDILNEDGSIRYENKLVTLPPSPQHSYAYCSDTKRKDLKQYIDGANMLYHEATFMEDMRDRAQSTFHTTAKQAAEAAIEIGTKKLLIGHFSTRYRDLTPVLEEAKAVFDHTHLAIEGHIFDVR